MYGERLDAIISSSRGLLFADSLPPPRIPSVQFLGNKERLRDWLFSFAPKSSLENPLSFLDAFSGSGVVAFEAKRRFFRVVAYFDPPYCMSHSDYQAFYHLLETFCRYWTDKEFVGGTRRYYPPLSSGFDKKATAVASFRRLFELARSIPLWLISYNDRSYPSIDEFEALLRDTGRQIATHRYRYENSRGGKGSVKGSYEVLFVARCR